MSSTGISTFNETLQLSNRWLNELMEAVGWDDKHRAYRLLRATLHALRDRLPANEVVHLGAQLPMLIRGLYYDGWRMIDRPHAERSKVSFLSHIEAAFSRDPNEDTEELVREVFRLLVRRISVGEIEDIKGALPSELRELWPANKTTAAARQPLSQRAFAEAEAYGSSEE